MADKKRIMMIRPGKRFIRMVFAQPLGLLSLISMLRKHYPEIFEVELVEQALYDLTTDQVKQRMLAFKPDLVLFSCLSVEANEMRELAALSKSLFPKTPVWIGGPHSTVFYDWELATGNVDVVCIGEGEQTFIDMIDAWLNGRDFEEIPGIALMTNGKIVTTARRSPIEDLDSLPLPAWDMIDFQKYSLQPSMNSINKSSPWTLLFTTRACPFHCVYCHNIFGKKTKKRSIEHVMNELTLLYHEHGVREIHIVDDIFNLDLPRAKAICDEIISRELKIHIAFPNGLRGDLMDRELIRKLKAAGTYSITYGVETASPRIQKMIKKRLNLEKVKEVIAWTDEEKIIPQGFFMLGFPGETLEEMQMTVDYAVHSRMMRAYFFAVVVYPRTELYDLAREEYPDFDFSGYDFFNFRYWAETAFYSWATGIAVDKIQTKAYRAFFLRPSIIARILMRFPKNRWLFRGLYWGVRSSIFTSLAKMQERLRPLQRRLSKHVSILEE
jgi:radical SAM superfamily enzyme YgiQ (UPF0313 family)